MVRGIAYAVTILALIALAITLREQIFGDAVPTSVRDTSSSRAATTTATHPRVESDSALSGSVSTLQAKENAKIHESHKPLLETSDLSFPESFAALTSQQDGSRESESGADVDTRDSDALIGPPFPVSESVEAECKRHRVEGENPRCTDPHEALAQFARERRDEAWATAMEEKIRDYLLTKEPGTQPIRALECRTSICAIECTSGYHGSCRLEYEFTRVIGLLGHGSMQGYETSATGAMVTVTVLTYIRREPIL